MGVTAEHYMRQLQALLPIGAAWPRDADANLTKTLQALGDEFGRVDERADALFGEIDPRSTQELLADWERVYGLPNPCVGPGQTYGQRIAALVAKVLAIGDQSRAYFILQAEALGYPGATIDEFAPMSCNDDCNDAIYKEEWRFAWRLNVSQDVAITTLACNSPCDEPLRAWGNVTLECVISALKPAHTLVFFGYGAP